MATVNHIYKSANETFLPWHIWVLTFGTPEDIELHDDPNGDIDAKELLYQRWLKDQKIISRVTKTPMGEILDEELKWSWD